MCIAQNPFWQNSPVRILRGRSRSSSFLRGRPVDDSKRAQEGSERAPTARDTRAPQVYLAVGAVSEPLGSLFEPFLFPPPFPLRSSYLSLSLSLSFPFSIYSSSWVLPRLASSFKIFLSFPGLPNIKSVLRAAIIARSCCVTSASSHIIISSNILSL